MSACRLSWRASAACTRLAAGVLVAAVICLAIPGASATAGPGGAGSHASAARPMADDQGRAVSSFQALQNALYLPDYQLYRSTPYDPSNPFDYLWPFTNATAGTDYLVGMPGGAGYAPELGARLQGLLRYGTGTPAQPPFRSAVSLLAGGGTQSGGDLYYDDNAWAALDLIHQYRLTRDHTYIDLAKITFTKLAGGWSTDQGRPCPGGVYWVDNAANRDRNTTSTASSAEVAIELYGLTGDASYLDWATRMYDWVVSCLQAPNGLYYDKIRGDGTVDTTTWSYNQGTMIGTGVLLWETTGAQAYLTRAEATAGQAVAYFGTGSTLQSQGPAFNGIYFRNLFLLAAVSYDDGYRAQASAYGDYMWTSQRDPSTGLFATQGSRVNGTAPMVEIYALLAGSPPEGGPVSRIFGQDAIATSVAVSHASFPAGSAGAVVLARSDFFSDALAGGPLAASVRGPLLITPGTPQSSALDPRVRGEIQRVLPSGNTVYLLGGPLALSPSIDTDLAGLGYHPERIAGSNAYATAVDLATQLGDPSTVFETTGLDFYDALSAVPAVIQSHGAILLTQGTTQAPETAAYLAAHTADTRYAIGGPLAAAGADPTATAVYGPDLYGTATAVASRWFASPTTFGAATSATFPDALSGGPMLGAARAPMLLVPPSGPLPAPVANYLSSTAPVLRSGTVFGGPLAVGNDVLAELNAAA